MRIDTPLGSVYFKPSGAGVSLGGIKLFNRNGSQIGFSSDSFEGTIAFTNIASVRSSWKSAYEVQGKTLDTDTNPATGAAGMIATVLSGTVEVYLSSDAGATLIATIEDGEQIAIGSVPDAIVAQLGEFRKLRSTDVSQQSVSTTALLVFGESSWADDVTNPESFPDYRTIVLTHNGSAETVYAAVVPAATAKASAVTTTLFMHTLTSTDRTRSFAVPPGCKLCVIASGAVNVSAVRYRLAR